MSFALLLLLLSFHRPVEAGRAAMDGYFVVLPAVSVSTWVVGVLGRSDLVSFLAQKATVPKT
jgi:hypothetical protein